MLLLNKLRKLSVEEIYFVSLGLLAFSIPLYKKITPLFIFIFLICSIIYFIKERKQNCFNFNLLRKCSIALYVIYALSMFVTTDIPRGKFDLEVKLSLLIFPLLISLIGNKGWSKKRFANILWFYVVGTLIATVICFGIAFYHCFTIFFTKDFFTYTYLADFYHPTYLAMFINLSITILFLKLIDIWHDKNNIKRFGILLLILYLIFFVLLLNSKAGILVLFLNIIGITFMFTFFNKKRWVRLLLLSVMIISSLIIVKTVPFVNGRFVDMVNSLKNIENINVNTENDSEQRILIWEYSGDIIANNWITGVGAGDVTESLHKEYYKNGFYHGIDKNLNCHNQFFQTFVATGISGFILLVILIFSILVLALKHRNIFALSFFIIITVTMLTESILEVQSGTVFFGFFVALLKFRNSN